jgi:hypothetical protein
MSEAESNADSEATSLLDGITSALSSVDATSIQRLTTLGAVHQARVARLTRTATDSAKKYGSTSAQATKATAAVAAAKMLLARFALLKGQVTAPEPKVAANGWALHGRVVDAQLQPVSGYTVYLVDGRNAYQESAGYSFTDSTGYFVLAYPGPASDSKEATTSLFVAIADDKARPVFLSSSAFEPASGQATYQNIALSASGKPIGDPPSVVRETGFPPADSSQTEAASEK